MEMLKDILQASTMTNSLTINEDEEYMKNGVIYCKKCNTPRETTIFLTGHPRKVRCNCDCMTADYERMLEEQRQRERQMQLDNLRVNSLIGKRYHNARFDKCDLSNESFKKAWSRCKKYCEISDIVLDNGYGIYLFGKSGTGKTHLMACMCNELLSHMKQCLFTNFLEISKSLRATYSSRTETEEKLIDKICDIDYLFIDDIGTERLTSNGDDNWMQEKVYDIINKRYNDKKPTVFTSNYSFAELVNERGMMDKTVDRMLEMSNAILKIEGNSHRSIRDRDIPF